jgi:hypothetical protein
MIKDMAYRCFGASVSVRVRESVSLSPRARASGRELVQFEFEDTAYRKKTKRV